MEVMSIEARSMYIVIYKDKAYGPFQDYMTCYDWAVIKFNGDTFEIMGVNVVNSTH